MEIGVNVWVRDTVSTEAWISGTIVDKVGSCKTENRWWKVTITLTL